MVNVEAVPLINIGLTIMEGAVLIAQQTALIVPKTVVCRVRLHS